MTTASTTAAASTGRLVTDLPEWRALADHARQIRSAHLRDLFAQDAQRGERFIAEGAGLYLDYSKHRITDETIRLIVIADNCADETARLAREAGAEVIERHDTSQRGKGHALAFGREHLRGDPPDCVVVLDADCGMNGADLRLLIETAVAVHRPVQSCYLLRSRVGDRPMTQISNFAFLIKNLIRQRGATALGAPAILGGTGMAFPWALFENAPLATSHLVEDLVLGIDFARAGQPPIYLETARTWSDPANQQATRTQRTRWSMASCRPRPARHCHWSARGCGAAAGA